MAQDYVFHTLLVLALACVCLYLFIYLYIFLLWAPEGLSQLPSTFI